MNLDDVTFWIMEEHLMPFLRKGGAIVGVRNTLDVQHGFECVNVVSSETASVSARNSQFSPVRDFELNPSKAQSFERKKGQHPREEVRMLASE